MTRPYPTGISRIEKESTWLARVFAYDQHGRRTKIQAKRFHDRVYGGQEKAFQAACAWVQENQKPRPRLPIGIRLRTGPSHSNTGIAGITHSLSSSGYNDNIYYDIYQVSYRDLETGRARAKSFYWNKYDNPQTALQAAIEFRQQYEQAYIQRYLATQQPPETSLPQGD